MKIDFNAKRTLPIRTLAEWLIQTCRRWSFYRFLHNKAVVANYWVHYKLFVTQECTNKFTSRTHSWVHAHFCTCQLTTCTIVRLPWLLRNCWSVEHLIIDNDFPHSIIHDHMQLCGYSFFREYATNPHSHYQGCLALLGKHYQHKPTKYWPQECTDAVQN